MPQTWQPNQAKKFAKELELNKPYYVVYDMATNLAPYEDSQTCSEFVFTGRLAVTGSPCTDGGYSAVSLCQTFGPVYDRPPRGMRNIADEPRQYGALLSNVGGELDEAEIRGLEKRVRDGSDPATRQPIRSGSKPKRRSWF